MGILYWCLEIYVIFRFIGSEVMVNSSYFRLIIFIGNLSSSSYDGVRKYM